MKRLPNRAGTNPSRHSAARQSKTLHSNPAVSSNAGSPAAAAPSAQQTAPITLQLQEAGADKPIACVEITANELSSIKAARAAKNKNIPVLEWSIGQWIKSALMDQASRDLTLGRPLFDLGDAINKAAGMLSLLADSNFKLRVDMADMENRSSNDGIDCGIELLAHCISAELTKAFQASFDYAAGLGKEAA
jgi:hypothetical protein